MYYINQLEYPDVKYPTGLDIENSPFHQESIKKAGCGLCSLIMVVNHITNKTPTIQELIELSHSHQANREIGTNLSILSPHIAKLHNLSYSNTDSITEAIDCLQNNGRVIANVGGDRDDYIGVFSKGGHYITLTHFNDDLFTILDPSWEIEKFTITGRTGKVTQNNHILSCHKDIISKETDNRSPAYHLFTLKI